MLSSPCCVAQVVFNDHEQRWAHDSPHDVLHSVGVCLIKAIVGGRAVGGRAKCKSHCFVLKTWKFESFSWRPHGPPTFFRDNRIGEVSSWIAQQVLSCQALRVILVLIFINTVVVTSCQEKQTKVVPLMRMRDKAPSTPWSKEFSVVPCSALSNSLTTRTNCKCIRGAGLTWDAKVHG